MLYMLYMIYMIYMAYIERDKIQPAINLLHVFFHIRVVFGACRRLQVEAHERHATFRMNEVTQ